MDHIRTADGPYPARCTTDGPSLNGSKDRVNTARETIDGLTNETLNETQKKEEGISLLNSSKKKPKAAKKTNPDIRVAIGHYRTEYLRIRKEQPFINGTAHKILKKLLEGDEEKENPPIQISELKELITAYIAKPDEKLREKGYPLEWLPGSINRLRRQKKPIERGFVH